MSETDQPTLLRRIADWSVRLGLPLAVLATVMAVFFGERLGIDHELQLFTPPHAEAGELLPVRIVLLTGLARPSGPRLASAPVGLTLRGPDGEVLAEATLAASPAGGADGAIRIPEDAPRRVALRAVARVEGRGVATATRSFELGRGERVAELGARTAHAMQHFELGDVEVVGDAVPPSRFAVRVVGGACVPETTCEVLVWVGDPRAAIRVAPAASIAIEASHDEETSGLARVALTVHGPEARVMLEALRGSVVVARRSVRLPIAFATPGLTIDDRIGDENAVLSVTALGDRPGVIVDAYRRGVWRRTGSVELTGAPFALPFEALGSGVWRLQVRTGPFSSAPSASRFVAVGIDADEAVARLQRLAGEHEGAEVPAGPDELRLAWAAAALETEHRELPAAVRGLEADHEALVSRRRTLRIAALVAIVLGLIVVIVVFLRRGVDAALEAQRVMEATGDPELASARHRRRTLLSALAIAATGLLAFLGAAALIVARAHLLE